MPGNSTDIFKVIPRILIVDNDEQSRRVYKELVTHWGYIPVLAQGDGKFLLDDAKEKAKTFRCQLALIDMRLIDDFDDDDLSGLELVGKIKPTVSIILSGHGNLRASRESIGKYGAASFVGKGEGPIALKTEIEKTASGLCSQGRDLKIKPIEIIQHIAKTLFPSVPIDYQDQLIDVLAQLFPNSKTLQLERLGTDHISSDFSTVPRPRSVILKVCEDDLQPVIVKLARSQKTKIEIDHYERYIHGHLVGNYIPVLQKFVILWDIGAAKFSYVGNIKQTFSHFYQLEPIEKIQRSLEHFFTYTWSANYSATRKKQKDVSLFDMYCKAWERDWYERRVVGFKSPDLGEPIEKLQRKKIQLPDSITWLKLKIAENKDNDASKVSETFTAVTHGDLHGDNLLVDENQNAWVVDFERTGEGHILQDFIELESDIINRLSCSDENFSSFCNLCLAVLGQNSIGAIDSEVVSFSDPETLKVLRIISILRILALQCTGISDIRQYLLGLLFNTIFRATIISNSDRKKSQQRALILASLLCHRLEHWDEPWPPKEWQTLL